MSLLTELKYNFCAGIYKDATPTALGPPVLPSRPQTVPEKPTRTG
jgi:hypothetical protein